MYCIVSNYSMLCFDMFTLCHSAFPCIVAYCKEIVVIMILRHTMLYHMVYTVSYCIIYQVISYCTKLYIFLYNCIYIYIYLYIWSRPAAGKPPPGDGGGCWAVPYISYQSIWSYGRITWSPYTYPPPQPQPAQWYWCACAGCTPRDEWKMPPQGHSVDWIQRIWPPKLAERIYGHQMHLYIII